MAPLKLKPFILPRLLTTVFICAVLLIGVWYSLFQARFLIGGPSITLTDELGVVQNERTITITGVASNITEIYLNGRPIVMDEAGTFIETVTLEDGYSLFRIDAIDRYGRTTYLERPFVYSGEALVNKT